MIEIQHVIDAFGRDDCRTIVTMCAVPIDVVLTPDEQEEYVKAVSESLKAFLRKEYD